MSSTEKFLRGFVHFCLSWRSGRYSLTHLFQNESDRYCTCLHLRLMYVSSLSKRPAGRRGLVFNRRMWLGVSGSRSLGSSDSLVIGWLLRMASISHRYNLTCIKDFQQENDHIFQFNTNGHIVLQLCQRLKAYVICFGEIKTVAHTLFYTFCSWTLWGTALPLIPNFVILCLDPRTYQLAPAPLLIFSRLSPVESWLNNVGTQCNSQDSRSPNILALNLFCPCLK